jgi:PhoH-like ATPase
MPLPTAPSKRAALLSLQDFNVPARPKAKSSAQKPQPPKVPEAPVTALQPATLSQSSLPTAAPAVATAPASRSRREPAPATQAAARPKRRAGGPSKLFVLDTNVLLHDPSCLFRFEEHDVFLPMIVLEELDGHKKGMTEVARNGRQTSRSLDALAEHQGSDIQTGLLLNSTGHKEARGRLFFQTQLLNYELPTSLPQGKADNQILGVVEALRKQHAPRDVVLVSKDINMRVKARALGLSAEDYQNDKTLEDGDLLYSGAYALPTDFWSTHGSTV